MLYDPQAFLFDLDGVFYNDTRPIPGGSEAIARVRSHGIPFRFITNTTSKGRTTLARKLHNFGIEASARDIFCPAVAAAKFLHDKNASGVFFVTGDTRAELSDTHEDLDRPDYLVLGDLGDAWTFARMNQALRYLLNGAKLIALGMTRYWHADDGPRLDVGPIAYALTYAAGQQPIVLGKPARDFFLLAARDIGIEPHQCAMIGDDIMTDIGGAQAAGMMGVLVKTGKFMPSDLAGNVKPDLMLESIAELMRDA